MNGSMSGARRSFSRTAMSNLRASALALALSRKWLRLRSTFLNTGTLEEYMEVDMGFFSIKQRRERFVAWQAPYCSCRPIACGLLKAIPQQLHACQKHAC